jgi:hypothetical protein
LGNDVIRIRRALLGMRVLAAVVGGIIAGPLHADSRACAHKRARHAALRKPAPPSAPCSKTDSSAATRSPITLSPALVATLVISAETMRAHRLGNQTTPQPLRGRPAH